MSRLPGLLPAVPPLLQLRAVLTAVQPAELVLPRGEMSAESLKVARGILRAPRLNELPLGAGEGEVGGRGGRWPLSQPVRYVAGGQAAEC